MTEHDDLARRLREAVETAPPGDDDIAVIAGRARRRRAVRRTVITGIAAVVVAAAAVTVPGLVRRFDHPNRIELAPRPSAIHSAAASPDRASEWEQLPPSPLDPRWDAFSASAGDALLVWGGYAWAGGDHNEGPRSDGAVYDGSRWSELPDSPLQARVRLNGVAAWTGDELWIVGGTGGEDGRTPLRDAAAYSPATRAWRALPPVPEPISGGVWAGDRLVVVAARTDGPRAVHGLSADGKQWRELGAFPPPSAPDNSDLHVLAAASRIVVVGLGDVFVRDSSSDDGDWHRVPAPDAADRLSNVRGAVAEPGAIVVLLPDGLFRYDFGRGAWSRVAGGLDPDPPQPIPLLHTSGGVVVAVDVVNSRLHAVSGGERWSALAALDGPRIAATVEVVGDQIVVWGGMGGRHRDGTQGGRLRASP